MFWEQYSMPETDLIETGDDSLNPDDTHRLPF